MNQIFYAMIKKHYMYIFDDICIPYKHFRKYYNYDIVNALENNKDILFYNEKYMTLQDINKFKIIYENYKKIIINIFSIKSISIAYVVNWERNSQSHIFVKNVINHHKYRIISPAYIINLYSYYLQKNIIKIITDKEFKTIFIRKLNDIINEVVIETKIFKKIFNKIMKSFVINNNQDIHTRHHLEYTLSFINSIIAIILDYAETLIKLNVHTVNICVNNVICRYLPLNIIYEYNHNKKQLFIV